VFVEDYLHTRSDVLYLLKILKSVRSVHLTPGAVFSESQLLALSRLSRIESISTMGKLVHYNTEDLRHRWSKSQHKYLEPENWKIPSFAFGDLIVPNIGVLFPQLKSVKLCVCSLITRTHTPSAAPDSNRGCVSRFFDQLLVHFPCSLKDIEIDINKLAYDKTIPPLDRFAASIEKFKISMVSNLMPSQWPDYSSFHNLTHMSIIATTSLPPATLKRQSFPPNLVELSLSPLWVFLSFDILSGQWIPFKDLSHLQTLNLEFKKGYSRSAPANLQTIDLSLSMPHVTALNIVATDVYGTDTLSKVITGFPPHLKALTLKGTGSKLKDLIPLTRPLNELELLQEETDQKESAFNVEQWHWLSPKLKILRTYGNVFAANENLNRPVLSECPLMSLLETSSSELSKQPLAKKSSESGNDPSNLQIQKTSSNKNEIDLPEPKQHNTVSGLAPVALAPLAAIPPELAQIRFGTSVSRIAVQFQRQYPKCLFSISGPVVLDANTWRVLLDENGLARDGVLKVEDLPKALAALMPNAMHMCATVALEPLSRVLSISHWSYIHTLVLQLHRSGLDDSIYSFLSFDIADRAAISQLIHLKTLIIHSEGSSLAVMLPEEWLPPNLTKFSAVAPGFSGAHSGQTPKFPPSLSDISLVVPMKNQATDIRLNVVGLPEVASNQFKSLDIQHCVFSLQSLIDILSVDASYLCCTVECFDYELAQLFAHAPKATMKLRLLILVSGAFMGVPADGIVYEDMIMKDTMNFIDQSIANEKNVSIVDDLVFHFSGPLRIPDGVTSIQLDGLSGMAFDSFELGPLPKSLTSLVCHGSDIMWEMVASAISESTSLKKVSLGIGTQNKAFVIQPTNATKHMKSTSKLFFPENTKLSSLEWFSIEKMDTVGKTSHHFQLYSAEWPNLTRLKLDSMPWFTGNSSLPKFFASLNNLTFFETASLDDSSIWWLFEGHPSIQEVIISDILGITGSMLPDDTEHLTWSILVSETIIKLQKAVKCLGHGRLKLRAPLSLPPSLTSENGPLKSLELTYDPDLETQEEQLQDLGRILPKGLSLTSLFPTSAGGLASLPLSLTSLDFATLGPTKPAMGLEDIMKVLEPLKHLKEAIIECELQEKDRPTAFRLGNSLPPSLTSLILPTAVAFKRTGIIFQPPPSLTELHAPMLALDTRYPIPATVLKIRVANLHLMKRETSQPPPERRARPSKRAKAAGKAKKKEEQN
jgi:hypothetical protein